ncbi:MAG: anthrone oxygenase family protein [Brevundimonas sp.]
MSIEALSVTNVRWLPLACMLLAVGAGAAGGVFFAFSTFVMPALARLPSVQGVGAMNAISVAAVTPLFMTLLFGVGIGCLAALPMAWKALPAFPALCVVAGSMVYLVAVIGVTVVVNVPLNNALAGFDPIRQSVDVVWPAYLRDWGFWNHVRTAGGLTSALLFALALARLK